jgi:hypothetical protein
MYKSIFEQTTDWQAERLGKFTASEIHKLMQKGRAKDQYFGETAQTYIKGRLAEILTQEPCVQLEGLAAIEWGNSNEIDAVMSFEKIKGKSVEYFGKGNPMFFPYEKFPDWAGGSPDGLIGDDGVIEVKCPYNSAHHITHLLIGSAEDLKKEKPDYYGQIQFNMLCTGRKNGFFISYDPRPLNHKIRCHVIDVPFDEPYCNDLEERISEAVKLLSVYLECINPVAVAV